MAFWRTVRRSMYAKRRRDKPHVEQDGLARRDSGVYEPNVGYSKFHRRPYRFDSTRPPETNHADPANVDVRDVLMPLLPPLPRLPLRRT